MHKYIYSVPLEFIGLIRIAIYILPTHTKEIRMIFAHFRMNRTSEVIAYCILNMKYENVAFSLIYAQLCVVWDSCVVFGSVACVVSVPHEMECSASCSMSVMEGSKHYYHMCARCTKKTNKHPFQMYNLTPQKWESYNFGECDCKRCNTHGTTTMTAPTSSDSNNSVDSLTTMEIFSYFSMLNKMKWVNILEFCGRFNEQLKVHCALVQLVEHHDFLWNLCNYGDNNAITTKQPKKKMSTSEEWT